MTKILLKLIYFIVFMTRNRNPNEIFGLNFVSFEMILRFSTAAVVNKSLSKGALKG